MTGGAKASDRLWALAEVGKPVGVALASWLAIRTRMALAPADATARDFLGAACLCGVGYTMALLMADEAFPGGPDAAIAKTGVLIGSTLAAALGVLVLTARRRGWRSVPASDNQGLVRRTDDSPTRREARAVETAAGGWRR